MNIIYKYKWIKGSRILYDYAIKHNHMITTKAEQRRKILLFWRKYGLQATKDAYGVSRATLYGWWKLYRDSDYVVSSLDPGSQAPIKRRKRIIDHKLIAEIKRLRFEVCPNMGKDKVKIFLDQYCGENNLKTISASTIGRIIKDRKIYHHQQKVTHFGKIKPIKRTKKLKKPKDFTADNIGDLIEIDTIVKFDWGIKRYIITAVDTNTRYTFAWTYKRPNSSNACDFFQKLEQVFPYRIKRVQTDNGSEFHKYFRDYLKEQKITHYWNYPGKPFLNGHIEKYNRTIQDEFIDQHLIGLKETEKFNHKLMDYLIWYNTKRPHWSLGLQSPVDYLLNNSYLSRMCWTNTNS
jgi:transposase InsO family protein